MTKLIAIILAFIQSYVWQYKHHILWRERLYTLRTLWLSSRFKVCPNSVHFTKIGMLNGMECISIGDNTYFGPEIYLTAWPKYHGKLLHPILTIGKNCNFGANNHITCSNELIIGDNCLTGNSVTITDNSHGESKYESLCLPPDLRNIYSKGPVCIGNNVWIGDKSTILPGVNVGNNVVIGANSVVTNDIPDFCIVAGIPARIITKIKNSDE